MFKTAYEEYSIKTFPFKNSGKIRLRSWHSGTHTTMFSPTHQGIYIAWGSNSNDFIYWKDALHKVEWLLDSGKTEPFGNVVINYKE